MFKIHYIEICFTRNELSAELFRMQTREWLCLCNMASHNKFQQIKKNLSAPLGRDFPEVESKGYDSKTLAKKAKAWKEFLTTFNSQNPDGIKRNVSQLQGCWRQVETKFEKEHDLHHWEARKNDGGGKAPASPSGVSKLIADKPSLS